MSVRVTVPYRKSFTSKHSAEETFRILSDFEKSIPAHFPGVEKLEKKGKNYQWIFESFEYSSYKFQIQLETEFTLEEPSRIGIHSVNKEGSSIEGEWTIQSKGSQSEVTFDVRFEIDLPIPFFLKSVAVPLAQNELSKFFDRYLARASQALAT